MKKGFTLIELLVVISIIGILMAISIIGLAGAREASRDAKRKSDLEMMRSGLELYKADCGVYPTLAQFVFGSSLKGSGTPTSCGSTNTYISKIPQDPVSTRFYFYTPYLSGYVICASLEKGGTAINCGGSCGGTGCNYNVANP